VRSQTVKVFNRRWTQIIRNRYAGTKADRWRVSRMLKVRYICRLFTKELVVKNFAGASPAELLERLIELSLYTEEHLK
jgi:hypothetical protein